MTFRRGRPSDAESYARTKIAAWNAGYRHFLPAEKLAAQDHDQTAAGWARLIEENSGWVAVDDRDEVIGYSLLGEGRFEGLETIPEVRALYVHPDFHGQGLGRGLMARVLRDALQAGHPKVAVCRFGLNANAGKIYESWGAPKSGVGVYRWQGVDYEDIAHVFSDLHSAFERVMPILIRRVREDDNLVALTEILHRAYGDLAQQGMRYLASHQPVETTRERLEEGEGYVIAAEGTVIGTATFRGHEDLPYGDWDPGEKVASFGQFAVDPGYQGFGIGDRMMAFLESRARDSNCAWLALDTSAQAARLQKYYGRLGYEVVGCADWRPVVNYESVVMAKKIALGGLDRVSQS